jgi:hypothetical protein
MMSHLCLKLDRDPGNFIVKSGMESTRMYVYLLCVLTHLLVVFVLKQIVVAILAVHPMFAGSEEEQRTGRRFV